MRLLDLFSGQGGAGFGYSQAGFEVTGVDIKPQPRYPFAFIQGDALEYLKQHGREYALIHCSPPCQAWSEVTKIKNRDNHPRLIADTRALLIEVGKPYVIENVAGARKELHNPVMLCGSMFGLRTERHRYFETSFLLKSPKVCDHSLPPLLVTTAGANSKKARGKLGLATGKTVKNAPLAYGIDWMDSNGLRECIPPAYTKWIGEYFLSSVAY